MIAPNAGQMTRQRTCFIAMASNASPGGDGVCCEPQPSSSRLRLELSPSNPRLGRLNQATGGLWCAATAEWGLLHFCYPDPSPITLANWVEGIT